MQLKNLLSDMVKRQASDLHIRVGSPPIYRIDGQLFKLQMENVTTIVMDEILNELLDDSKSEDYKSLKDLHFAFGVKGLGRFRVSIFQQRGTAALAIRSLALEIPQLDSLGLPDVLQDLALKKRGFLLLTGATGAGKSTAAAGVLNHINENIAANIITVEDPIEYLHKDQKSMVAQREVGHDTQSYSEAVSGAMKQDPDVLYIGEIKDVETLKVAIKAADTGHFVISTMNTSNVSETIQQLLAFYPPSQYQQVRMMLSLVLVGIVSLQLLPAKSGESRVAASEILVNGGNIKQCIQHAEEEKKLIKALEEGYKSFGSQSFDQSLLKLHEDEKISYEVAYRAATHPEDFKLRAQGIEKTSDRSWAGD